MAEQEAGGRIKVSGVTYDLPERLTVGEMMAVEMAVGQPLPKIDPESMTMQLAMTYVAMRREAPRLTWEDFCKLDLEAFEDADAANGNGDAPAADPTPPKAKRTKSASAK
jgi:hypothetical protein